MRILLLLSLVLASAPLMASDSVGVYLESLDSVDRNVRVTYVAPPTSAYADPASTDTVFCALDVQTAWYKRAIVVPMKREASNRYRVEAVLPDSAYNLRIEICIPTDRVPEGIAIFKTGPEGGYGWVDSSVSDRKVDSLTATLSNDPLLYNYYLWNMYFYPVDVDGKHIIPPDHFERTRSLAAKYPRSSLGELWIQRYDVRLQRDTAMLRSMIDAWRSSWDVDVLSSIAHRLLLKESACYDPADALWFIERAERSSREQIAFRSGENIYASMGRLGMLAPKRIQALDALGRYTEACAFGRDALARANNEYEREVISKALITIGTAAGDSILVQEVRSAAKPVIRDFTYTTLDGVQSSISAQRGKIVVIDFWFAGCAGCAAEHKALNDLATRYANRSDIVFLSVSLNDAKTLQHYLAKKPLAFQTIPDGQAICDRNGVTAFPTHVILNKDGTTALWETGGSTLAVENLEIGLIMAMRR